LQRKTNKYLRQKKKQINTYKFHKIYIYTTQYKSIFQKLDKKYNIYEIVLKIMKYI